MNDFPDTDWRAAADALVAGRQVILPDALPAACWQGLRAEAVGLLQASAFAPARIGRGEGLHRQSAVRGDGLCWLQAGQGAGSAYLAWMDTLRQLLNRELFLGLDEFEAHYAHYPVGAFYRTHVDRHRDSNARVVSTVLYLNADWRPEQGGELCMYDNHARLLFSQPPVGGTLVLFMSDDMPHEVKPALRERWSIAGWFRSRA